MDYDVLSKRQLEVLGYIKKYVQTSGYPPTVREIARALNLKSPATVHTHLRVLEEKGFIKRDSAKQRALEIIDEDSSMQNAVSSYNVDSADEYFTDVSQKELAGIPLLGTIAAGQPLFAEEQVEDVYPLPVDFLNSNKQVFMLRVRGESMIEAGILNGDLIIVEKTTEVRNGEIAAVLLDDSATVKYFYKEKDHIRLEPANSAMSAILAFDVQVLGRVIGLMRRF